MRFPILALVGALVATPAIATPSYIPAQFVRAQEAAVDPIQPLAVDSAPRNAADDTRAIFSAPTEPVPLMPSQRKALRMRKA